MTHGFGQELPAQRVSGLIGHVMVGQDHRMSEDEALSLVVIDQFAFQEVPVLAGQVVERGGDAIGLECLLAAHTEPHLSIRAPAAAGLDHHFLVVAAHTDDAETPLQLDEPIENAACIGSAIHEIAEHDESVVRRGLRAFDQLVERNEASVDVADGEQRMKRLR